MKKIALYIFAAIGLFSSLLAFYSLFTISGSTMYGSSGSLTSIPGPIAPTAQYAQLEQVQASTSPTPVAFTQVGGNAIQNNAPLVPNATSQPAMKRMIIRNANLTLEVNDISKTMNQITNLANNSGGYVVSSNSNQGDEVGIYNTARISIRIPAEGLQKALDQLKTMAIKVKSEDISGEDITQKYVDLQSTLKNLETTKAQLEKIMDGAKKTEDVLDVFKQLTDTQGQIDLVEGQIKYYSESVALSLIDISLEIKPASPIQKMRSWDLVKVAKAAYQSLLDQLEQLSYGIIVLIIYFLPLLVLWGLFFLALFLLGKAIYRRFDK
ncbi:DUF4349 domain-containing protein [Legionella sp. km772]|uniref:DUF4349 domain-containing protein n=1 Tax=Legionella sp. km772 TaxID=2498111 RepID=UPI000F8D0F23|nr:DUF4349 domain-containing protein [Legionella sp. km772]RUR12330.1 DUF4349 domain-containing protein [Legionella sp. km772]